jgi:hypothetical protein
MIAGGLLPLVGIGVIGGMLYWLSPEFLEVGYMPEQPVPYSHKLHVSELGLDCRYCHNTVERGAKAAIPPAATCMNCHAVVKPDSPKLAPIRAAFDGGEAVEWVRVHMLPDYAYFDHSVHVGNGVGCVNCHGRVDQMEVVRQEKSMSMRWCLECHRSDDKGLGPFDKITDLSYDPHAAGYDPHTDPDRKRMPTPPEHCSGCHR